MTSVMFNTGATIARETLRGLNAQIADSQITLITGLSVRSSDDNPAAWAVSKVLEADVAGFRTVRNNLAIGDSTISVARQATETITDLLTQARELAVGATTDNVDKAKIQNGIDEIADQITSIVSLTQFNGLTLLENTDSTSGSRQFEMVASIERTPTEVAASTISVKKFDMQIGVASLGTGAAFSQVNGIAGTIATGDTAAVATIAASHVTVANAMRAGDAFGVDTSQTTWGAVAGFAQDVTIGAQDRETVGEFSNRVAQRLTLQAASEGMEGLLFHYDSTSGSILLTNQTGDDITFGADSFGQTDTTGAAGGETIEGGLAQLSLVDVTTDYGAQAAVTAFEGMIDYAIEASSHFGSSQMRIGIQQEFLSGIVDQMKAGIGLLVDADMEEEVARFQALQVQRQLATQALSISNNAPRQVLALFR